MGKRFKPKVRITAGQYRIVETSSTYGALEKRNGFDAMGVQQWRYLTLDERSSPHTVEAVAAAIGRSIATKRKRARRKSK